MPTTTTYSPSLDELEIYQFLEDQSTPPNKKWEAALPKRSGYFVATTAMKLVDSNAPPNITMFWLAREVHDLMEGLPRPGQMIGSFEVHVPREREIQLRVWAVLMVKNNTKSDIVQRITAAFEGYQYPRDGDVDEYILAKMKTDPTIEKDMFAVDYTFSVEAIGALAKHEDQLNYLRTLYAGKGKGTIYPKPGEQGIPVGSELGDGYFGTTRHLYTKLRQRELERSAPLRPRDYHEVVDSSPPIKDPGKEIRDIENRDGAGTNCEPSFDERHWVAMTLLAYPEFMVEWVLRDFDIGCGVHVVLSWPRLRTRTTNVNLYVCVRFPKNMGQTFIDIVCECATDASLTGAVIAVVSTDIRSGLIAFYASFDACVLLRLHKHEQCLIPGLAVICEAGQWQ